MLKQNLDTLKEHIRNNSLTTPEKLFLEKLTFFYARMSYADYIHIACGKMRGSDTDPFPE